MTFTNLLTFVLLACVGSGQILTGNAPATIYFTPYKLANCSMSENITDEALPSAYAVTSGRCYNSTYAFLSYAQATNFNPDNIPCAMSIFPQVDCVGDGVGVQLSNCAQCFLGPLDNSAQSFELACGP